MGRLRRRRNLPIESFRRNTRLHNVKSSESALRIAARYIKKQYPLAAVKSVDAVRDPTGDLWLVKLQVRTNPKMAAFKNCDLVLRVKTGQVVS